MSDATATNPAIRNSQTTEPNRWRGTASLLAWGVGLAVMWLVVLPWVSRQERVAAEWRWLESRGIDPSAMYYTELEAMKPILQRLNQQGRTTSDGN